jgi:hypothetical protein
MAETGRSADSIAQRRLHFRTGLKSTEDLDGRDGCARELGRNVGGYDRQAENLDMKRFTGRTDRLKIQTAVCLHFAPAMHGSMTGSMMRCAPRSCSSCGRRRSLRKSRSSSAPLSMTDAMECLPSTRRKGRSMRCMNCRTDGSCSCRRRPACSPFLIRLLISSRVSPSAPSNPGGRS